ncbi:TonB-dependent receptor [Pseudoduganella sp. SL102]|uniref:TonB-dependent receptor n=1 Tax=Pseudoduganella sp. SL102 TaxID=2995154 RepID=UPI00248BFA6C|nr:TonB-dependent receptor [Pseudoduganella sp. SL102]WBS05255.1 TonB-dependent receptor [Pseudoduganella sp. SL102]
MNKKVAGAARRRLGRDALVLSVISTIVGSVYAQSQAGTLPGPVGAEGTASTSATASTTATTTAGTSASAAAQSVAGSATAPVVPTVTVSGYRSSLGLSAAEKRDNIGLSDTVFSEDMGKFPDPNIADALSRIPGVQVTRASIDGEGMNISIRGMGPAFTRVLLNGAPMASASAGSWGGNISANREVDMDFLPSELFRSATVYKSQQASVIEGGIAGTVNMRSVRPFDKAGLRSAFTLSGNYRDQDGKWGNTGSALISNTWKSSTFGRFGILGGVAWGNTKYKTDAFQTVDMRNLQLKGFQATAADKPNSTGGGSQSTPDTVPSGLPLASLPSYAQSLLVPGKQIDRNMLLALNPGATLQQIDNGLMGRLGRHIVYQGERKRAGEVISVQWQPNDQWDIYLDTLFAQKENSMLSEGMNVGTRANTPIPIGLEFDRSDCTVGCVITKGTFANTFWSLEFRPMEEKTVFRSFNPGFEWRPADKWTIDGHVNYTKSTFWRDMPTVLLATPSANSVITYDNTTAGQTPTYTGNLDVNDAANFGWYQAGQGLSGLRMDLYERTNTTKGSRLNVNWGDSDFALKVGGAWDDIERRYRGYSVADAWMNVACGNNVNARLFAPNTQLRTPGCDGRSTPGAIADAATAYPGYGTGVTAGGAPLAYLGSVVPNAAVPQYAHPSNHGFITVDWPKFAKDTDYQFFRDNIYQGFNSGSGGYIREVVTSAFAEINGRAEVFGRTLRYNAGLRHARTKQTIGDLSFVADPRNAGLQNGGLYPNLDSWAYETTRYSNTLPSATLAYNITPNTIFRLSGSKSLTRANPADLRQTRLSIGDQGARQGNLTNPNLKPFAANNLDAGIEYYFSREAYVAASAFAKDITSRPGRRVLQYTLSELDALYGEIGLTDAQQQAVTASGGRANHLVEVTEPYNIDTKLKVRGVELTWQQPLDMLPVKGFGFTGNFTYTKQTDEAADAPPVAGVPPRTNNFTLYYERNGLSARVSRQHTAAHVVNTSTGITVPGGAYAYTTERKQVDLSLSMNLKRMFNFAYNTDVTLSAWNLNNAISQTYTQFSNAIYDEYKPGRSYTMSLRTAF